MKRSLPFVSLVLILLCASAALAQTVTGTISNGTTGKPAAGIEVVLVDPMQGMAEVTKTKTDAQGKYSLSLANAQGPRLVRASKDGANYFKMLTPGTTSADLEIYDAAQKVDGVTGTVNVVRVQTEGNSTLQILELFAIKNGSNPPRTVMGDATFEVVLPEGAHIDGGDAQGPNGQPLSLTPQPTKEKNHYAFSFPLRPGETRFQVAYHMPYNGEAAIAPKLLRPYEHFVVVLPQSMKFEAKNAEQYRPMPDQTGTNVQVVTGAKAGQDLAFRVSGTGVIPEEQDQQQQSAQGGQMGAAAGENRPGGGLGPPIDAPDPLTKYKWWILGIFAVVLGGGAYIMMSRPIPGAPGVANSSANAAASAPVYTAQAAAPTTAGSGNALLDAMKEELFLLEVERQQGTISQEDYLRHKAALDQTLQRALSRKS